MKIKPGANYVDMTDTMKAACLIIESVFNSHDYELVLTSGRDGIHGPHTLHLEGNAGDFRTRQIRDELKETIRQECKTKLGKDYDVILETDHLHAEFDPKGK